MKYFVFLSFLFVIGCNKSDILETQQSNIDLECPELIELYDYNQLGMLHNYYLEDILENNNFDKEIDLASQIESYMIQAHNIDVSLETILNGDPYSDFEEIIARSSMSNELYDFSIPFLSDLFSDGIRANSDYQIAISNKVATINSLSSSEDRIRAKSFLAVLSHSIYFWLPTEYCGMNGISYVSNHNFNSEIQVRKDWLTNFADIWSHDLTGALIGGAATLNPGGAAGGMAMASGVRAVSKAWNGDY